jgi:NAD-dependent SIR2 family protein deacetylase
MDPDTQELVECPYCGEPMDPDITMHSECLKSLRAERKRDEAKDEPERERLDRYYMTNSGDE